VASDEKVIPRRSDQETYVTLRCTDHGDWARWKESVRNDGPSTLYRRFLSTRAAREASRRSAAEDVHQGINYACIHYNVGRRPPHYWCTELYIRDKRISG
jgi:hypothetical protein